MADNYLEKKMEQHKARAAVSGASKKISLSSLLEHSVARGAFDGYAVRQDQLMRIVGAAVRVSPTMPFRFRFVTGDEAARLRSCHEGIIKATAYILVLPSADVEPSPFLLGRVAQSMLLQAAEMGLCGAFVPHDIYSAVSDMFALPLQPLMLLAFGRSAEPSLSFDAMPCDVQADSFIIE